jgi:hypothetical protein
MRLATLSLATLIGCRCGEEDRTSAPTTPTQEASTQDSEPDSQIPARGVHRVQLRISGNISLNSELISGLSELGSRLQASRQPDEFARHLSADPEILWGEIRPILAIMAEPPATGLIHVEDPNSSALVEVDWWNVHPGQVDTPDRGQRRTPLTLILDIEPDGIQFSGHDQDEDEAIARVRATSEVAPGGAVPVLLRIDDEVSWGRVLKLAKSLDSALKTGRVALWHRPPPATE